MQAAQSFTSVEKGPPPKSGAVLFGKNLPRLAAFYEDVPGLSVALVEHDLIVAETASQQLVLHGLPARIVRSIAISVPPALRTDTAVKLVFVVDSLAGARDRAVALGGAVRLVDKEFEALGFRACDANDPEGNVIQLRQAGAAERAG